MRRFMKKLLYIAALLPIMFVQCTKDDIQVEETVKGEYELVNVTFAATFDDEDLTKTTLEGGNEIHWKSGDKICIFDNVDPSVKHEFTATVTGDKTSFSGTVAAGATKYFAVYPYSAAVSCDAEDWDNKGTACAGKLQVEIPEIQEAVEGSFDPIANICMGYTTSTDSALKFRIACCLLKFQVKRDDIVAISFSGSKNMSGSLQLNVTSSGGVGTGDGTGTKLKAITVKKSDGTPFVQGQDYYAVVRYRTGDNAYGGFTADLVAEGGLMATKVASSNLGIERAHIKSIGNFDGLTYEKNLYDYYQKGYDLVFGAKTYNKSSYGDAILLASGTALSNASFNKKAKGVYFFESGGSFSNAGELNISTEVIISSTNPSNPATLTFGSSKTWNLNSGSLVMNGIVFDNTNIANDKQSFLMKNASSDFDYLAFFNCKSNNIKKYFLTYNSNSYDYVIKEIVFDHCILGVASNDSPVIINSSSCTRTNDFEKFTFANSILYNTADATTPVLLFNYYPSISDGLTDLTWKMEAILRNNILYNVASNGSNIRTYKFKSISVTGNIVCCPDYEPTSNMKLFTQRISESGHGTLVDASDNIAFAAAETSSKWIVADDAFTTDIGITKELIFLDTNPLTTADKATQTFVVASTYSSYGPQAL